MSVLYLIQTYKNLPQIVRLVTAIKRSSPQAAVVVSHNRDGFTIDPMVFGELSNVHVTHVANINRVDFSLMQAYLDAVAFARTRGIEFDWVVNLSGQCYPARSLAAFEQMLATTPYDGFMDHYEALTPSERNPWDRREASGRYNYHYHWRLRTTNLPSTVRRALSLPRRIVNNVQPFFRVDTSYGLQIGVRSRPHLFNDSFKLYGGSFFKTLSRRALEYFTDFAERRRDITDYFRATSIPDEAFPQTVLLNNSHFSFSADPQYYIKWDGGTLGSPCDLTVDDYPAIVAGGAFFARKFDPDLDSRILDILDARVLGAEEPQHAAFAGV